MAEDLLEADAKRPDGGVTVSNVAAGIGHQLCCELLQLAREREEREDEVNLG